MSSRLVRPFVVVGLLLLCSSLATPALAWDPASFLAKQEASKTAFDAKQYDQALGIYNELVAMIDSALSAGEIPPEQQPMARQALTTIRYQIGRCQQLGGQCEDAGASYVELAEAQELLPDVAAKIPFRIAETAVCAANSRLAANDLEAAREAVSFAKRKADLAKNTKLDVLSAEDASQLRAELELVDADLVTLETAIFDRRLEAAAAIQDCVTAQPALVALASEVPPGREEAYAKSKVAVDERCTESSFFAFLGDPVPWGPIAVVGGGVLLLVGDAILEGVLVGTISDFDDAKAACEAGEGRCEEARSLADDIDTGRVVSIVLLAGGVAAIGGGVLWWLLSGDEETSEQALGFVPLASGAALTWRVTF